MKKRKILITGIISSLLLTTTLSAQSRNCKNGKCFIDLSKLSPSKSTKSKIIIFKSLKKTNFTTNMPQPSSTIVLDHSKYIMSENESFNSLVESEDISNREDTIVLSHSKYVMSDAEKEVYNMNQRLKKAELERSLIVAMTPSQNKISESVILPHSELYCDNAKLAVFHPARNYYECV